MDPRTRTEKRKGEGKEKKSKEEEGDRGRSSIEKKRGGEVATPSSPP